MNRRHERFDSDPETCLIKSVYQKSRPWGFCVPRRNGLVVRVALVVIFVVVLVVFKGDALLPLVFAGARAASRGSKDLKDLYFPSINRRTTLDRISVSVLTSKKTFSRVAKFAPEWVKAGVRLSVWLDELPTVIPLELEAVTYESTAKKQGWWKETKQDFHTRLAWTLHDTLDLNMEVAF
jgi:hypothetical protein